MGSIAHKPLSTVSGQLTGKGELSISTLLSATNVAAPPNGLRLWRFSVVGWVESYNDDLIWTASSANRDSIRAGRFIIANQHWEVEEVFLARRFNMANGFYWVDADNGQDTFGSVGSGSIEVNVPSYDDASRRATTIYYECEKQVFVRFFIRGTVTLYCNNGNDCTFYERDYVSL